jgi:hypothetical protein
METYNFSQTSFSVPRWLLEMDCFRFANWGLHVSGNGVLSLATGKQYKKTSLILTANPTCALSP